MTKLLVPPKGAETEEDQQEALRRARSVQGGASASDLAGVPSKRVRASRPAQGAFTEEDVRKDFRLFVILLWAHLRLPAPTPLQLSIAWYLQHSPHDRVIIMAFRGVAKSWLTGAYVLWSLWCAPQMKIMVASASLGRAQQFTLWCLALINEMPLLKVLRPKPDQRQSSKEFDVGPARPDQSPSLAAKGISGQLAGSRADLIVPDDVEIASNSLTPIMRDKINEAVKEFDSILKPGGHIKYLGTPHDEDCLYNKLAKRGFVIRIWPALYPDEEMRDRLGEKLSPFILDAIRKDPSLVGHTTEPSRFTDEDLEKRRLSLGASEFALQFLLDTSMSDRDKYPLKLKQLMVLPLDTKQGPSLVTYGMGNVANHLPNMGMGGDVLHAPAWVAQDVRPYTRMAASDISGRGADETTLVVVAELHGFLFVLKVYASLKGYAQETLEEMAAICVRFGVHQFYCEANFGDGMFTTLFRGVLSAAWQKANDKRKPQDYGGTEIVEIKAGNQASKERRILSVLEPVTEQHRLVFAEAAIEEDYKSLATIAGEETRHKYSLMWQYTHLTRDRNSLPHDDRLDALAMGIAPFAEAMGIDPVGLSIQSKQEIDEDELEAMLDEADDVAGRAFASSGYAREKDRKVARAAGPQRR